MAFNKKQHPVVVAKVLSSIINRGSKYYFVQEHPDYFLLLYDKDSKSDFFFSVDGYFQMNDGSISFNVRSYPESALSVEIGSEQIHYSQLEKRIMEWEQVLEEYESISVFSEDPIENQFAQEYYSEFKIVEDDADTACFSTEKILLLDQVLTRFELELSEHKTDSNTEIIQELISETQLVKSQLTTKTKSWVIREISKIWGKTAKQGPSFIRMLKDLGKTLLTEVVKGVAKGLTEGSINSF